MITIFSTPEAKTPTLEVSRAQAVRLFREGVIVNTELVDGFAAWTFRGGVVLIHDHAAAPRVFRLCLDGADGRS